MKVVRSAVHTGRLYPPRDIPGTHFCLEAESIPTDKMQPEGLCQSVITMTASRIEPATFRLVSQCPPPHPTCSTDVKNERRCTVTSPHLPYGVQFHLHSLSNCRPIHMFHQNDIPYCADEALRPVNFVAVTHSINCHR
jgi:hypothetical protein